MRNTQAGYVSTDYRHVVDEQGRPLMLITGYSAEGNSAVLSAVDEDGKRWVGVASPRPNARVIMRASVD